MEWIWTVVLNAGLGLAAYGVARFRLRQPAGLVRTLAAAVLAWGWLTIGVEILGAIGWLDRGPLLGWVAAGLVVALGCWLFGRNEPTAGLTPGPSAPWTWEEFVSLGLVLWAAATLWGPAILWPVKVVSDGPIYHLYFAARWWKADRLDLIAAPFGETAATYFPAVGDLWFTWLIVGFGGERLAKVGQAPFLALAALAAVALARRLGAGRPASVLAAVWFIASTPLFLFSFEPNVDTIFVAGYVLSAYFFARHVLADDGFRLPGPRRARGRTRAGDEGAGDRVRAAVAGARSDVGDRAREGVRRKGRGRAGGRRAAADGHWALLREECAQ